MADIKDQVKDIIENGDTEQTKKLFFLGIGYTIGGIALAIGSYVIQKLSESEDDIDEYDIEEDIEEDITGEPTDDERELPLEVAPEKANEADVEEDTVVEPDKEESPKGGATLVGSKEFEKGETTTLD